MNESPKVDVTGQVEDGVFLVRPVGRLDHSVADDVEQKFRSKTNEAIDKRKHVVVDLGSVNFLSSIILKIIRSQKEALAKHELNIALCNPTPVVREILQIAKFDFVAELHDGAAEASASVCRGQSG